jgi:hypothetical protein
MIAVEGIVIVVIFGALAVEVLLLRQLDRAPSETQSSATIATERNRFMMPPENSAIERYRM